LNGLRTFEEAQGYVLKFEEAIRNIGLEIELDSELEAVSFNIIDLFEKHLNPELRLDNTHDIRPYYRDFVGWADFASKIISASKTDHFEKLKPHLKLLNQSDPTQNYRSRVTDQTNNKIFELFMACLCINAGVEKIELDDPNNSKGDNPDIITTFLGKTWGLGCKAAHSMHGMTLYENIEKAVKQIELSDADTGFPVLSAKNIIDHDKLWNITKDTEIEGDLIFHAHPDTHQPIRLLFEFSEEIKKNIIEQAGEEVLKSLFNNSKSKPCCLIYLPTATSVLVMGKPTPTRLSMFNMIHFLDALIKLAILDILINNYT